MISRALMASCMSVMARYSLSLRAIRSIGVLDAQHLKDGVVQLTPVVEVEFIGQIAARITLSDLVAGSNRPLDGFR